MKKQWIYDLNKPAIFVWNVWFHSFLQLMKINGATILNTIIQQTELWLKKCESYSRSISSKKKGNYVLQPIMCLIIHYSWKRKWQERMKEPKIERRKQTLKYPFWLCSGIVKLFHWVEFLMLTRWSNVLSRFKELWKFCWKVIESENLLVALFHPLFSSLLSSASHRKSIAFWTLTHDWRPIEYKLDNNSARSQVGVADCVETSNDWNRNDCS